MKPLHVLRGILRTIQVPIVVPASETAAAAGGARDKIHQGQTSTVHHLRQEIIGQYRKSKHISSQEEVNRLRKMAYDYYILRTDLIERYRLYELDGGAEVKLSPKELSRRAAARAGLQLPKEL